MVYASIDELKETLSLDVGTTFADDDIALALSAASQSVDSHCRRSFGLGAEDTSREYYVTDGLVGIDDLVELTTVERRLTDGTYELRAVDDYELAPLNASADGEPYTALYHPLKGRVRITGTFGWPAVPDPVKQATTLLAARLMKRAREAPFGVAGFGMDGGVVRIAGSDPDVAALLAPYQRNQFVVA